jgi:hypothetical protein
LGECSSCKRHQTDGATPMQSIQQPIFHSALSFTFAMRPSSFVSSAPCSSSGHAASCRPADAATDSAPTVQRARHGSAAAASMCSLRGPGVCSGPLPALAAAAAAPIHSPRSAVPSTATAVSPAAASTPAPRKCLSQLAAAPSPAPAAPHQPRVAGMRSTRVDAGAHVQLSQRRARQGQLPLSQAAPTRPGRNSARRLLGRAAASVAAVIFACSVASCFARHVAVSGTSGRWSTAALSQARGHLAATSLPDAGVAIFAGGYCTSCDGLFGV